MQNEVLLVGGPNDGEIVPLTGIMVEVPNPDKEKYGPYEFLAYAYERDEDGLIVGRWNLG
jgi:hypothetical protein